MLSPALHEGLEDFLPHIFCNKVPIVFLRRQFFRILHDTCGKYWIFHIFFHHPRHRFWIAHVAKKPRWLRIGTAVRVGKKIRYAAHGSSDDRELRGKCLHERAPHPLDERRAHENIRELVECGQLCVAYVSGKDNAVGNARLFGDSFEFPAVFPLSRDKEFYVNGQEPERADDIFNTAREHEAACGEKEYIAHVFAEFLFALRRILHGDGCGEFRNINTIGDNDDRPVINDLPRHVFYKIGYHLDDVGLEIDALVERPKERHEGAARTHLSEGVAVLKLQNERHGRTSELEKKRAESRLIRHHRPDGVIGFVPMERAGFENGGERKKKFCELYLPRKRAVGHLYVLCGKPDAVHRHIPYFFDLRQCAVEPQGDHVERILVRIEPVCNFLDSKLRPADERRVRKRENENALHTRIISSVLSAIRCILARGVPASSRIPLPRAKCPRWIPCGCRPAREASLSPPRTSAQYRGPSTIRGSRGRTRRPVPSLPPREARARDRRHG